MKVILFVCVLIVAYLTFAFVRAALIVVRIRRFVVTTLGEDDEFIKVMRWNDWYFMDRAYWEGQSPEMFAVELQARWCEDGYTPTS